MQLPARAEFPDNLDSESALLGSSCMIDALLDAVTHLHSHLRTVGVRAGRSGKEFEQIWLSSVQRLETHRSHALG